MRGVPKTFGTEQDIINSMAEDPQATKAKLREMLVGRFAWFAVQKLEEGEVGLEDATHKVVSQHSGMGPVDEGPEERWQYELQEDANAFMFKIDLTVDKINSYLL